MGFNPFEPQAFDSFSDWAQKAHREAFVRRKLLFTPDTLTSHTTMGVFHKINPNGAAAKNDCPPCECEESEWDFQIGFRLPLGGASPVVELFDLENAEPWTIPLPAGYESAFDGYYWLQSGVRLTRTIKLPFVITLIEVYREPVPEALAAIGPNGFAYNIACGPHFHYGPIDAPRPNNYPLWPFVNTAESLCVLEEGEANRSIPNPGYPFTTTGFEETGEYHWGGMLRSTLRPDIATQELFGGVEEVRRLLIEPGTEITLSGKVQQWSE